MLSKVSFNISPPRKLVSLVLLCLFIAFPYSCKTTQAKKISIAELQDVYFENIKDSENNLKILQALHDEKPVEFKLGAGDIISVSVYGEPDMSLEYVPIQPDGNFNYMLIGSVHAEGKTVEELRAEIEGKLKQYIKEPNVMISPKKIQSGYFSINGKVRQPGIYPIEMKMKLSEAVAKAGGLATGYFRSSTIELANLDNAFLRRGEEILPVNFVKAIKDGDALHDIPIKSGDYIFIPSSLAKEVMVLGQVNKPSAYGYQENITFMQAIARAEGFTEQALRTNVYLVRGSIREPRLATINAYAIMKGKEKDFYMQPNDIIYVPTRPLYTWARIMREVLPALEAADTYLDVRQKYEASPFWTP